MNKITDRISEVKKNIKNQILKRKVLARRAMLVGGAILGSSTLGLGFTKDTTTNDQGDKEFLNDFKSKIENTSTTPPMLTAEDVMLQFDDIAIADTLVVNNQNIIENFDTENYKFSKDELDMIQPCEIGDKIGDIAYKTSKKSPPIAGEQTYCLRRVKQILSQCGISLDAGKFAYKAIDALRDMNEFVEIKCDLKDFKHLPEGTIMVFDKGPNAPYGHIGIKKNDKDCSDYAYGIRTTRGRFGSAHAFLHTSYQLQPELVQKMCQEGVLKEEVKEQIKEQIMVSEQEKALTYQMDIPFFLSEKANKSQQNLETASNNSINLFQKIKNGKQQNS